MEIKNNWFVKLLLVLLVLFSIFVISGFIYLAKLKFIAIVFILVGFIMAFKNLKYGLYFVIFSLPFAFLPSIFGKLALSEALIFLVLSVFCVKNLNKDVELKKTKFDLVIFLFFIVSLIALSGPIVDLIPKNIDFLELNHNSPVFVLRIFLWNLEFALAYFLFVNVLERNDIRKVIYVLFLANFVVAIFALYQFYSGVYRVTGFFEHANLFGMFLVLVLPLSIYFSLKRKFFWIFSGLLFLVLIITFSRGAWLGFFFSMIFFTSLSKFEKKKKASLLIIFFILLFVFSNIFFYIEGGEKDAKFFINRLKTAGADLDKRVELWKEALNKTREEPIFGYGSILLDSGKEKAVEHAHNLYLQLLLEKGIFVLGIFLWLLFLLFKDLKKYRNFQVALVSGLFGLLVHGLFDYVFYSASVGMLFFIYLAFIELSRREDLE